MKHWNLEFHYIDEQYDCETEERMQLKEVWTLESNGFVYRRIRDCLTNTVEWVKNHSSYQKIDKDHNQKLFNAYEDLFSRQYGL